MLYDVYHLDIGNVLCMCTTCSLTIKLHQTHHCAAMRTRKLKHSNQRCVNHPTVVRVKRLANIRSGVGQMGRAKKRERRSDGGIDA